MEKVVITLSQEGFISSIPISEFTLHKRGGVGIKSKINPKQHQFFSLLTCFPLDDLFLFTNLGKVYRVKAYDVALKDDKNSKSSYKYIEITKLLTALQEGEKVLKIISLSKEEYEKNLFLLFATKGGIIKKTSLELFKKINKNGKIALKLRGSDSLQEVIKIQEESGIILASSEGKVVHIKSDDLRKNGRDTSGVIGIKVEGGAYLISAASSYEGNKVLSIGEKGIGKLTSIEEFRETQRGAIGVCAQKINERTGNFLGCLLVRLEDEILLMSSSYKINRFKVSGVSEFSRSSSGVRLIKLDTETEKLIYFAKNEIDVSNEIEETTFNNADVISDTDNSQIQ